ncbi:MAG: hypothetical protein V7707_14995 [Motiliproteus sp.]
MMKSYSDALVELGNQAWILNVALAELHGFTQVIDAQSQLKTVAVLSHGRQQLLQPAIARLQTRLQALLIKWQRRMIEETGVEPSISYPPWGCQVRLPDNLQQQMRVETAEQQTLAHIRAQALQCPDQFFICTAVEGDVLTPDKPSSVANLTRFRGVESNVARMWWSWSLDQNRLYCRSAALADNLWLGDSCRLPRVSF